MSDTLDTSLAATLGRSALVRGADAAMRSVERAYRHSRAAAALQPLLATWRASGNRDRLAAIGQILVVASVVHGLLLIIQPGAVDWRRFVIPAIALCQGALLSIAARGSRG